MPRAHIRAGRAVTLSEQTSSTYAFFGRVVRVESDAPDVLAALNLVYERQRLSSPEAGPENPADGFDVMVTIRHHGDGGPRIEVGGRTVRVPSAAQLAHYAHLVLVNVAAAGADQAIVLHGGAVVRAGAATLLVGGSGWGKSTLTLELVRRGWGLLSDDFAVVRTDGVVEPFPRRVNLSQPSLDLLGVQPPEGSAEVVGFAGGSKWMIDVDQLYPGSIAGPARLGTVFVLSPKRNDSGDVRGGAIAQGLWRLEVDHCPPGFEPELCRIPGVRFVTVRRPPATATVIELTVEPGAHVVRALDAACAQFDVAVLSAARDKAGAARFDGPPSASLLAGDVLSTELLVHTLSLSGRRFFEGTTSSAVLDVLGTVDRILRGFTGNVYRLMPGALGATADLVEQLTEP